MFQHCMIERAFKRGIKSERICHVNFQSVFQEILIRIAIVRFYCRNRCIEHTSRDRRICTMSAINAMHIIRPSEQPICQFAVKGTILCFNGRHSAFARSDDFARIRCTRLPLADIWRACLCSVTQTLWIGHRQLLRCAGNNTVKP